MSKQYVCPVCGFNKLAEEPFGKNNEPSFEICSCCGFESGADGDNRPARFNEYRKQWIKEGAQWLLPNLKPKNWDYRKQLENL